jgi:hypothetical protein
MNYIIPKQRTLKILCDKAICNTESKTQSDFVFRTTRSINAQKRITQNTYLKLSALARNDQTSYYAVFLKHTPLKDLI